MDSDPPNDPTELAPTVMSTPTDLAYSDEAPTVDYDDSQSAPRWRVVVIASAIVLLAGMVAAGVLLAGRSHDHPAAAKPTPTTTAPIDTPNEHDQGFMDKLHQLNVPADDWHYYVSWAQSICDVAQDGEPPGDYGFDVVRQVVQKQEPDWSTSQVYNFTATTYSWYCPRMWGPSEQELAAMKPEDRLVALIGSRAGVMVKDPATLVSAARTICSQLDAGRPQADVIDSVHAGNQGNKAWTAETSKSVVDVSIEVLCPSHK